MRPVEKYVDGIYLLGQYAATQTRRTPAGCWMLYNKKEAAIVDLPPTPEDGEQPFDRAQEVCRNRGFDLRYILCTHADEDHFSKETYRGFRAAFPDASPLFHKDFQRLARDEAVTFFQDDETVKYDLAGEPFYLIHAPKHSPSDTVIVFRGAAMMGDWELETLRSMNDDGPDRVPIAKRRQSIDRLMRFSQDYTVHVTIQSRADHVRRKVDFGRLLGDTLLDTDFGWGRPIAGDEK